MQRRLFCILPIGWVKPRDGVPQGLSRRAGRGFLRSGSALASGWLKMIGNFFSYLGEGCVRWQLCR